MNSKTQIEYGSQQEFLWKNSRINSIKSTKYGSVENVNFFKSEFSKTWHAQKTPVQIANEGQRTGALLISTAFSQRSVENLDPVCCIKKFFCSLCSMIICANDHIIIIISYNII